MIEIKNLIVEYPSQENSPKRVLDNITLTIKEGESIALMGGNGAGKTTFALCLNGLLLPSSGQVMIDGFEITTESNLLDLRRNVGMVFQNPDNQIVSATVEREVAFGLENLGIDYDTMHRIVPALLRRFELTQYRTHSPHYLSGGEKQRLALAAVLAMQPKYLILDEPTSLLDPKSRNQLLRYLQELHDKNLQSVNAHKVATVLITQFPEEALIAERLLIMSDGKIVMDDTPDKIFTRTTELTRIGLEPPAEYLIEGVLQAMNNYEN